LKSKATGIFTQVSQSQVLQKAQVGAKDILSKAENLTKETTTKVKTKLDDSGVSSFASQTAGKISTGGKMVGGFIVTKAKAAKEVVSEKIDNNEKLSNARDVAKEKASSLTSVMSKGVSNLFQRFK
jgi:hypothetical protein